MKRFFTLWTLLALLCCALPALSEDIETEAVEIPVAEEEIELIPAEETPEETELSLDELIEAEASFDEEIPAPPAEETLMEEPAAEEPSGEALVEEDPMEAISNAPAWIAWESAQYQLTLSLSNQETQSVTLRAEDILGLRVSDTGEGYTYQWQYGFSDYSSWFNCSMDGADTACMVFAHPALSTDRPYRCQVSGPDGVIGYTGAVVVIDSSKPRLLEAFGPTTAIAGKTVHLSVKVSGEGMRYRWKMAYSAEPMGDYEYFLPECCRYVQGETGGMDAFPAPTQPANIVCDGPDLYFTAARDIDGTYFSVDCYDQYNRVVYVYPFKKLTVRPATVPDPSVPAGSAIGASYAVETSLSDNRAQTIPLLAGDELTLTDADRGEGLSYQWESIAPKQYSWQPFYIEGSDTAILHMYPPMEYDGRRFRCAVWQDGALKGYSGTITLQVSPRVRITLQPTACQVDEGETARFRVEADGEGLSYEWQQTDRYNISWQASSLNGADTPELAFTAEAVQKNLCFRCLIRDCYGGSVCTETANLALRIPAKILQQPASLTLEEGQMAEFDVWAQGDGLTYRWQTRLSPSSDWIYTSLEGCDTRTLSFAAQSVFDGRQYRCELADVYGGTVWSEPAGLTVLPGSVILGQPASLETTVGGTARFSVQTNESLLRYQWEYCTTDANSPWQNTYLDGYNTDTLCFPVRSRFHNRQYRCKVTDRYDNCWYSQSALLTIAAPRITSQPADLDVESGKTARFEVTAQGDSLRYRWEYRLPGGSGWTPTGLSGASTACLSFTAPGAFDGRQFRCVVTDIYDRSAASDPATLGILQPLRVLTQPAGASVRHDETAAFHVVAQGTRLSYQWQWRSGGSGAWADTSLNGCRTAALSFSAPYGFNGRQYCCVVTDGFGNRLVTDPVTLTVSPYVYITVQPAPASVAVGGKASFSCAASGTGLKYQWQYREAGSSQWKNTSLSGATTSTLSFAVPSGGFNGRQYRCVVTDRYGKTATTSAAALTVR